MLVIYGRIILESADANPTGIDSIKNLLGAACLHAPRLRELLLGCQMSNLSAKALTSPDFLDLLKKLAPGLIVFKLDLSIPHGTVEMPYVLPLADVLRKAQKLEHLYLTLFRDMEVSADLNKFLREVRWPHLKVLDLGDGCVDFQTIKTLT